MLQLVSRENGFLAGDHNPSRVVEVFPFSSISGSFEVNGLTILVGENNLSNSIVRQG